MNSIVDEQGKITDAEYHHKLRTALDQTNWILPASRSGEVMTQDDMAGALIDPALYSVLKEAGVSTARYASGKFKSNEAQMLQIAYLVGLNDTFAQHEMEKYPDDDTEPPQL